MLTILLMATLSMLPQEAGYAWQASEWRAPDALAYFPDDEAAGQRLDAWWQGNANLAALSDAETIHLVRQGLRRTTEHRTVILRWLGNRFVWGQQRQDPAAIELMYHAADWRPEVQGWGMRHYAVYFGLSVTHPKTPNILRALVELCMAVDDPNDLGRVAWGAADQREALLSYLTPFLDAAEPAVRAKAEDLERIYRDEIGAFAWAQEKARARAAELFSAELPTIKATLQEGDSPTRRSLLDHVKQEALVLIMDDSFLPAFAACATDGDASVRRDVVRLVGQHWVWSAEQQSPEAIALMLQLSTDTDAQVRYDAVYYGLSTVREAQEAVVRRLLDMALAPVQGDLGGRIQWGLRGKEEMVARLLEVDLKSTDRAHAAAAFRLYPRLVGRPAPIRPQGIAAREDLAGTWTLDLQYPDGQRHPTTLVLVLDEDGRCHGSLMEQDFRGGLITADAATVHLAFSLEGEGGEAMVSAILQDGHLRGSFYLPEERMLLPFVSVD